MSIHTNENRVGFESSNKHFYNVSIGDGLTICISNMNCGLCNILKNFLSILRIKKYTNFNFFIEKNFNLQILFDFPEIYYYQNYNQKQNLIYRNSWRLALLDSDKNLDKIINNNFSLMFPDFSDHLFFKNYNNNSIDFIYRPDLFNDIYEEYSKLFSELIIKKSILEKIHNFYNQFNKNTISVHLRSWVDSKKRQDNFDINKFYNKIDEFNNGENNFFIASDNINLCYQIKEKYGNKIIIYDTDYENPLIKAFIELILLSKNNILIGTYISTFTEMAYLINYNINKKIIIL